jgi:hemolysin D
VVPSGQVKVIQSATEGVVKSILVRDGQRVKSGESLFILDEKILQAERMRTELELSKYQLEIQRIEFQLEELKGASDIASNPDLSEPASNRLLRADINSFRKQVELLNTEISRSEAATRIEKSNVNRLKAKIDYYRLMLPKKRNQANEGLIAGEEVDDLEYETAATIAEYESTVGELDEAKATLKYSREKLEALMRDQDAGLLAKLSDAQFAYESTLQEYNKIKERFSNLTTFAPVDGTVQEIGISTIGGYLARGEETMVIVPANSDLQIDIQILDRDVGYVSEGMIVDIKVNAFEYTRFGMLKGSVDWIGSDAVVDEVRGLVYPARIEFVESFEGSKGGKTPLITAGMGVSLDIQIGERRMIEFFLSPLLRYKRESLNER